MFIDTILGGGLGFISAIVSPAIKGWQKRKDAALQIKLEQAQHEHEIELLEISSTTQKQELKHKKEDLVDYRNYQRHVSDMEYVRNAHLYDSKNAKTGGVIGSLQASVRPVLTYSFSAVFLYILLCYIITSVSRNGMTSESMEVILNNDFVRSIQFLFSNIITFWFGDRSYNKG